MEGGKEGGKGRTIDGTQLLVCETNTKIQLC